MAVNTDLSLRRQVIYSVFVRGHTKEGTFRALEGDLDRLKALGADILWLMPIHPIGEEGRKGTMGSPYAIRDYRAVNPDMGTVDDLCHLVDAIHDRGMECIIDVVYNHTSPDSVLAEAHPEFFLRDEQGRPTRKVTDWWDIVDLDYSNRDLWRYQIDTLKQWAAIVDGFRCDVASAVPVEFWRQARVPAVSGWRRAFTALMFWPCGEWALTAPRIPRCSPCSTLPMITTFGPSMRAC